MELATWKSKHLREHSEAEHFWQFLKQRPLNKIIEQKY